MLPLVVFLSGITFVLADVPWYQNGIIYQLYPRSFQDSDGDGIGDLKGVLQRIDYLASLGVSAVWFSPLYPSPNEDFGYDISNFTDINPEYGTLKDFDEVVARLKEKGIRVLLDFVPNHSSTDCKWFQESEKNKSGKYSDYYVWKDPKEYDSDHNPIPPNNWLSVMGTGSAWKWSKQREQFYLHNFLDHQADFNYANENVLKEMANVMEFWMKRGVSGFRVDAVSWLYEDQKFRDEPPSKDVDQANPNNYNNLEHIYTMDLPETVEIVKQFRSTLDSFSKHINSDERIIILESYSDQKTLLKYYGEPDKPGATFPFNFQAVFMNKDANSTVWANSINDYYNIFGNRSTNWVLGNHDQNRVASKWSEDWVDVLHIIMMTLKGTAVTYNGEEIGLEDNTVRWDQAVDIQGIAAGQERFNTRSRDFERGPMPWDTTKNAGFSKGKPWLPLAPSYWKKNVKAQNSDERSHLKIYQELAKLRKGLTLTFGHQKVIATDQLLYIKRSYKNNPTIVSVVNLGDVSVDANIKDIIAQPPEQMKLIVSSINYLDYKLTHVDSTKVHLPPKSGVVLSN